jgi:hypothetical protein
MIACDSAVLDGVHARGARHVLAHHFVDGVSGHLLVEPQGIADHLLERFLRQIWIKLDGAAGEGRGIDQAQRHIGVGYGGIGAAAVVANRSRNGGRTLRAYRHPLQRIEPRLRSAAGADLDHRNAHRKTAALEEAVGTIDLEHARRFRTKILDQADLGRGTAHVEGQHLALAKPRRDLRGEHRPARRSRFNQPHWKFAGGVDRGKTAAGSDLIEASVMIDSPVIVSGVAAFIKKLPTARTRLNAREIGKRCAIEVVRTGRFTGRQRTSNPVRRLGNATWILGVKKMKEDPTERQQKRIDRRTRELNERLGTDQDDFARIRWGKKSRFGRECRAGDTLMRIFNWRDRKHPVVTRSVRVLLKDPEPDLNRLYTEDPAGGSNEVSGSRFQRILKQAGFPRGVKPMSALKLDPAMAKIIDRKWTRVQ